MLIIVDEKVGNTQKVLHRFNLQLLKKSRELRIRRVDNRQTRLVEVSRRTAWLERHLPSPRYGAARKPEKRLCSTYDRGSRVEKVRSDSSTSHAKAT